MRKAWVTAPIWESYPVVIVAGGESFSAAQARLIGMARARDRVRVIAVNDAVYPCWFADIAYAADAAWWLHHGDLPGFQGMKLSIEPNAGYPPMPEFVDFLRNTGKDGFDTAPDALRTGENGGYQTIHLAAHLGARKMLLVGFDNRGTHWFGRHPAGVRKDPANFNARYAALKGLAAYLKKAGIEVRNASPGSAIDIFPSVDLATEIMRR